MKKLILIEDNTNLLSILEASLGVFSEQKIELHLVTNYLEGVELIAKLDPDYLVTDLFLPYSREQKESIGRSDDFWLSSLAEMQERDYSRVYEKIVLPAHRGSWGRCHVGWPFDFMLVGDGTPKDALGRWKAETRDAVEGRENHVKKYAEKIYYIPGVAAWGYEIFKEHYASMPTVMMTSSHAHSNAGTYYLLALQLDGRVGDDPGVFYELDAFRDVRLCADINKSSITLESFQSNYILKLIESLKLQEKIIGKNDGNYPHYIKWPK